MRQTSIQIAELKHLKVEFLNYEYIVTLVDKEKHEIIKGYGKSINDAINDMHQNLL